MFEVRVNSLDVVLSDGVPDLLKINVEGFESNVMSSVPWMFADRLLTAVIIERNGNGACCGFDFEQSDKKFWDMGFFTTPKSRTIASCAA